MTCQQPVRDPKCKKAKAMRISYRGFDLSAAIEQLADSSEWTTRVLITKHRGSEVREKFCSASNAFKEKSQAEEHSIEFGKQIVDGLYQNTTVDDL